MLHIIVFISFILIFIYLYLYVKLESFNERTITTIPNIKTDMPISNQIISEVSRVLNISQRRITNLIYKGDISEGRLNVIFIILDPNPTEVGKKEKNAKDSAILANTLTKSGTFKIFINGISITLYKLNKSNKDINVFFDNTSLLDIADYSKNKYISIPNDDSLTKFYKLNIDNNFNISPKL